MAFRTPLFFSQKGGSMSQIPLWNGFNPKKDGPFFRYIKDGGGVKLPPQSKIFKNDPKKLKLTPKLEHIKIFPKHKEKICSDHYF